MVSELQYVAVAAFLIWGLASSVCGLLAADPDAARLVWRQRGTKPTMTDVTPPGGGRATAACGSETIDPAADPSSERQAR